MMLRTTALAAAFTLLALPAFAQTLGQFDVAGKNPDGSAYAGTASIEKTGDTYRVNWTIGGERFVGTGIGSPEAIAVSYRSGSNIGIVLLGKEGEDYVGVWAYLSGRQLGAERWTKR